MVWKSLPKKTKRAYAIKALKSQGIDVPTDTSWKAVKEIAENNDLSATQLVMQNYKKGKQPSLYTTSKTKLPPIGQGVTPTKTTAKAVKPVATKQPVATSQTDTFIT